MSSDAVRQPAATPQRGRARSDASPAVAPGKRPLTMRLPAGAPAAPAQRQRGPTAGTAQRRHAADTARWTPVAMRPDLHAAPALPSDGPGAAMPAPVQAKMEGAFGVDLSSVRIHEGPRAAALGALAYTQGTDVHFAPGAYRPDSTNGQELLGHELTHVVQQSQGRVGATAQAKGVAVNDDAGLEREADEQGARAARGERVGGAAAAATAPARPVLQATWATENGVDWTNDETGWFYTNYDKFVDPEGMVEGDMDFVRKYPDFDRERELSGIRAQGAVDNIRAKGGVDPRGVISPTVLNVVGEVHVGHDRSVEEAFAQEFARGPLWREGQLSVRVGGADVMADPFVLRFAQLKSLFDMGVINLRMVLEQEPPNDAKVQQKQQSVLETVQEIIAEIDAFHGFGEDERRAVIAQAPEVPWESVYGERDRVKFDYVRDFLLRTLSSSAVEVRKAYATHHFVDDITSMCGTQDFGASLKRTTDVADLRDRHFFAVANQLYQTQGIWKIGRGHTLAMAKMDGRLFNLVQEDDYLHVFGWATARAPDET